MACFTDYDTITDQLYWVGSIPNAAVILNFVVKLSKKDKNGNRNHFHKEYEYASKFIDTPMAMSIKRSFDYYFTIETTDKSVYIQIRLENMIGLQSSIKSIAQIIINDDIWALKDKRLVLKGAFEPINIKGLPMDKWLAFEPIPVLCSNGSYTKGVRMYMSDYNTFVDIDVDKFMGMVYLITTFNMYGSATTLINYLNWSDYGTNLVTFEQDNNVPNEGVKAPNGRRVQAAKSFFDLDNM